MPAKKIPNRQKTPPRKPKQQWHFDANAKRNLAIGVAALALVIILWIVLYNMPALKVNAEGLIDVPQGQYWLVYNERTTSNPRYIKMGEVQPIEGYVLDNTSSISDRNEFVHYFKPESETQPQVTYAAMVGKQDYQQLASSTVSSVPMLLQEPTVSEVKTAKFGGRDVAYYLYSGARTNQEDATIIDGYSKQLNAYVAGPGGRCVVMMLEQRSETGTDYQDDAAFEALLDKAVSALSI